MSVHGAMQEKRLSLKNEALLKRAGYAMAGLRTAWRSEKAFRQQMLSSIAILALTAAVGPGAVWWALIVMALCGAAATELMNAGLESLCDRVHPEFHPMIGAAKDLASAAVFTMNTGLTVVLLLMLGSRFL
ncbi:diacylglycerol kinase [Croceicoccus ponticola]|uniref:Diacylglycerol kinase n=1 Tax=Croceicoccus ponticola TaxID=2217664 RepID=A0A437GZ40_9SPHN|nr:diacylglycerol kinase [Croceicoccus ponticola]